MIASEAWRAISALCLAPEKDLVEGLRSMLDHNPAHLQRVVAQAEAWISAMQREPVSGFDALTRRFQLGSTEGLALMSLSEALLRIPDARVADELIRDVLAPVDWERHRGASDSRLVNVASRGLALARRWLATTSGAEGDTPPHWLRQAAATVGHPVIRRLLRQGVQQLADHYVLGNNMSAALRRARTVWPSGITHSFDILGEAALTSADSEHYYQAYFNAIDELGDTIASQQGNPPGPFARSPAARPGLSVKLSALHPRYQPQHWTLLQRELVPRLTGLVERAARRGIVITLDAEEAERYELQLMVFERCLAALEPAGRSHLGLALQAYSKRAWPTLLWLLELSKRYETRIPLRLVKGAYWDTEIKRAQQRGLSDYPVFTTKNATDISYLACARWLLAHRDYFYPQFGTHNAVTAAAILQEYGDIYMGRPADHPQPATAADFEFQRLHGMGEALFRRLREQYPTLTQRVYAPVGNHRDLLPYLVRRLLENGANSSFVSQLHDSSIAIADLARHPLQTNGDGQPMPSPRDIFLPQRSASRGIYLATELERQTFLHELNAFRGDVLELSPSLEAIAVNSPYDGSVVGTWRPLPEAAISELLATARAGQRAWQARPVAERASCLERVATLLEEHRAELVTILIKETGKTLENAMEEVREAADFCRHYAVQAIKMMSEAQPMPGTVGEDNELQLYPRGVFLCISPWNFPVAIFAGQIAAALTTGNAVVAKPAEQATLTAQATIALFWRAGIPPDTLQLAAGAGETLGAALCATDGIDGIAFTGGWTTSRIINQILAARDGPIIPFIAETGGINALLADSSAYPPQLVADVLRSAFDNAGQRCSALRLLFVPTSIGLAVEQLLCAAMQELHLGDPLDWGTDIGPVIDGPSRQALLDYIEQWRRRGRIVCEKTTPPQGQFVAPTVIRLESPTELDGEHFGPILHLVQYDDPEQAIAWINSCSFGLTCGIHTRNEALARRWARCLPVGNCYINRDMIGAVVGSQPFGGTGKSGTGFKAGGPHYLLRFVRERTVTVNTAAWGGDQRLLGRLQD